MGPERINKGDVDWKKPVEAEKEVRIPSEILLAIQEVPNLKLKKLLFEYATLQEQRIALKVAGKEYESAQKRVQQQETYSQINGLLSDDKESGLRSLMAIVLIDRRSETRENVEDGNQG